MGLALVANSLCPGQEKHMMRESEVQIGNSGYLIGRSGRKMEIPDKNLRGKNR
jgi:hypothetical protein